MGQKGRQTSSPTDRQEAEMQAFIKASEASCVFIEQLNENVRIPRWSLSLLENLLPTIKPILEAISGQKLAEHISGLTNPEHAKEGIQDVFDAAISIIIEMVNPIQRILWLTLRKPENATPQEIKEYFDKWSIHETFVAIYIIIDHEFLRSGALGLSKITGDLKDKISKSPSQK